MDLTLAVIEASKRELWLTRGRENLAAQPARSVGIRLHRPARGRAGQPARPSALWTNRFIEEALRT